VDYVFGVKDVARLVEQQQDQDGTQFHPDPARKLSTHVCDIDHC
jgi:hypothetical protein